MFWLPEAFAEAEGSGISRVNPPQWFRMPQAYADPDLAADTQLLASSSGAVVTIVALASGIADPTLSKNGTQLISPNPVASAPAQLLTLSAPVVAGETWKVRVGATAVQYVALGGSTLSDIASNLASSLRTNGVTALAAGTQLGLLPSGGTVTTAVIAATAMPVAATSTTNTETLTGPAYTGDTWTLSFAGSTTTYPITATPADMTSLASAIAGQVAPVTGYSVFASASTIYMTSVAGGSFTSSVTVARDPSASRATVSGTPHLGWVEKISLLPAGSNPVQTGDRWTVSVNDGSLGFLATTTASASQSIADIVAALAPQLSNFNASGSTGDLVLYATDGSPLTIAPVTQFRPKADLFSAADTTTFTEDVRPHYYKSVFTLFGNDSTGGWSAGEVWTVTVDGKPYTYTVPSTTAPADRTLQTIAAGLVAAINATTDPITASVASNSPTITIADKDVATGGTDPFVQVIKRGGGHVTGVFNAAGVGDVSGKVEVSTVPPQYQWLINLFPFFRFYFANDTLSFTSVPVLRRGTFSFKTR